MLTVKVAQLPGMFKEMALEDGSTIADALRIAELSSDGFAVSLNGNRSELSAELEDGDTVTLAKSAKGNA